MRNKKTPTTVVKDDPSEGTVVVELFAFLPLLFKTFLKLLKPEFLFVFFPLLLNGIKLFAEGIAEFMAPTVVVAAEFKALTAPFAAVFIVPSAEFTAVVSVLFTAFVALFKLFNAVAASVVGTRTAISSAMARRCIGRAGAKVRREAGGLRIQVSQRRINAHKPRHRLCFSRRRNATKSVGQVEIARG